MAQPARADGDPDDDPGDARRRVPPVHRVLADPSLAGALDRHGRERVRRVVRRALDECRDGDLGADDAPARVLQLLAAQTGTPVGTVPVLNATGVLVHTNLGRAPLGDGARAALLAAAGCTDVELDLGSGRRGPRGRRALELLRAAVPAAEAALVVNNGAAAIALAAAALAGGREVVVSRGELVEIGDGFRIADLLTASGATLREVGATNRVRLEDYADAVGERTGMLLKVHPSNFRVEGFTAAVPAERLASLGPPVVVDLGSGLLAPHALLPDEPDAASTLAAGADLVTASGDKLLGGPQCGLVLGRADLVERLRRHPLARAVRADKLTLAALAATLDDALPPVRGFLEAPAEGLTARAEAVREALGPAGADLVEVVDSEARVGGGGAPGVVLPSVALALPERYAAPLRSGDRPVVGRVRRGRVLLDLRSVAPADDAWLVERLREVLDGAGTG